jgi:glycosyltransferase involved in cell wall biosynthesis
LNGSRSRSPAATRIAIVTPWFGPDLRGGAEQQSWQLAHQLAARGHAVDVLTTCCAGFNDDWAKNALRQGAERRGLLTIRRFRVHKRDRRAFERVNAILMSLAASDMRRCVSPIGDEDARLFYENNINSPGLYAYLAAEGHTYAHVLFLPYLYGPTLFGLPLVAERAYLQPCLHNESYAYLGRVAEAVHAAKGILLNSEGEYELALRLFGPGIVKKSIIVGEGVDVMGDPAKFSENVGSFVPSRESYVLYLGRQDPAKNVPTLVNAYGEFRRRQPATNLKLVLAGERPVSYGDPMKGIVDVGPVSEAEKSALLLHARALVQPSTNESFSRVIYESWMYARPVVVHRECLPTATAVARSGGGFSADSAASWVGALERIDFSSREELDRLGRLGRTYAETVSSWPEVIARYEAAFKTDAVARADRAKQPVRRIVQAVSYEVSGEARTYADALAHALDERGVETSEFSIAQAEKIGHEPTIKHQSTATVEAEPTAGTTIVYHLARSAASGASPGATHAGGVPNANGVSTAATNGTTHAASAPVFASSPAALEELEKSGVHGARFLPVCIDPRLWDDTPDVPLISALQDGKHNLLFAGPIRSIENLNELLIVFLNYLTLESEARLTIAGNGPIDEAVYAQLFDELRRLELVDRVLVARDLSRPQYQAVFRAADVFICLDEGEGYGLELLQAMWFDVPVIAYRTAIAREIVGAAGLLLSDKSDYLAIAALAQILVTDLDLRAKLIAAQRRVRERFDESNVVREIVASFAARRERPEPTEASPTWPS